MVSVGTKKHKPFLYSPFKGCDFCIFSACKPFLRLKCWFFIQRMNCYEIVWKFLSSFIILNRLIKDECFPLWVNFVCQSDCQRQVYLNSDLKFSDIKYIRFLWRYNQLIFCHYVYFLLNVQLIDLQPVVHKLTLQLEKFHEFQIVISCLSIMKV